MKEIKCPKCGELFTIDESGYAAIVKQVHDEEFEQELARRVEELQKEKDAAVTIAVSKTEAEKDKLIADLKEKLALLTADKNAELSKKDNDTQLALAQKEAENEKKVAELQAKLDAYDAGKAVEIEKLKADHTTAISKLQLENKDALSKAYAEKERAITEKDSEIQRLNSQLQIDKAKSANEVELAVQKKEQEILQLQGKLDVEKQKRELSEKSIKEAMDAELKRKDEEIAYYKDFKARQSTKMVGENLEQHCLIEFNKLRPTAFRNAYFEKDNDISNGSKGDFIYRESGEDGTEFISIMFEMKNEMDDTEAKHKNEDFFKKLDKDRKEKKCEYAILVSMLEADNELYNTGIVDVSYQYEKMYVVRPQFFIPIITILRNAALNSLSYKQELALVKSQNIDITKFEDKMIDFKTSFTKQVSDASNRFNDAIKGIDDTIAKLETIKKNLVTSNNHLVTANKQVDDLSIRKLTWGNPTMQKMFAEAKESNDEN